MMFSADTIFPGCIMLYECLEDKFKAEIESSDILSRGWVFQEIRLATANLFCTSEQMWWSCLEKTFSHSFPKGIYWHARSRKLENFVDNVRFAKMGSIPALDVIQTWTNLIRNYPSTTVIHEQDRLVAISGIASTLESNFRDQLQGSRPHSGLWTKDMIQQILWRPDLTDGHALQQDRFPSSEACCLPSWSPMSCRTRVSYEAPGPLLPIEVVSIRDSEIDQFGRASSQDQCVLHFRAVLVDIRFSYDKPDSASDILGAFPKDYQDATTPISWDNIRERDNARAARDVEDFSHRACIVHFDPTHAMGFVLRPVQGSPNEDDDQICKWVRCGIICIISPLSTSKNYQEAFQIKRYGVTLLHNRWTWRMEPTGERPDLDDIYLV